MKAFKMIMAAAAASLCATVVRAQPPGALCVMGVNAYCAQYGSMLFGPGRAGFEECVSYYRPIYEEQCD